MATDRGLSALRKTVIRPSGSDFPRLLTNGTLSATPEVEYDIPEYSRSMQVDRHRAILTRRYWNLQWQGVADFEQIIDFLNMSVGEGKSDTAPARVWTFSPDVEKLSGPRTYRFYFGDNVRFFISDAVLCSQLTLSASVGRGYSYQHLCSGLIRRLLMEYSPQR